MEPLVVEDLSKRYGRTAAAWAGGLTLLAYAAVLGAVATTLTARRDVP